MLKLIKFMRPFVLPLLVVIALLFGQAMADLALPDYMSNIVNVGIQQGGNEQTLPGVLREQDLGGLKMQLSEDEAVFLDASYETVAPGESGYDELVEMFPAIDGETVYRLTDLSASDETRLGNMLALGARGVLQLYQSMGADMDAIRNSYILHTGLIMLGIALLGAAATILVGFISAKIAAAVGRNLREAVFEKVSRFTNAEFDRFSTASLITRSTNDIMQVQTLLVIMIRMFFYAPIMAFGGIMRAMSKNSSMSWTIGIAVGLLLMLVVAIFSVAMPKFKLLQKLVDRVNLVMRENLTGMMVVRAFNTQSFEEDRFDKANEELTDTNLFVNRVMVFMFPVMMLIMNGTSLLIIWVGAHEVAKATMQVGDMMAFMQYAMLIIFSFLMLSMMFVLVPRASVAANRIAEVLEADISIEDPDRPRKFADNGEGKVVFDNVSFKYGNAEENMLKGVSFTANPGETTAIIGSTGSGKTTLINLIPRFYDVTGGSVTIDGMDVRAVSQQALRDRIGYVPQKASLFSGTIASNMLFANESASDSEMAEVIDIAQAAEIVEEKDGKMEAAVSQNGGNLSGGQKQRLSIARALIKKPDILIFDDSFSALDYSTDRKLRKALRQASDKQTVIVVAQRIATIMNAEQILVMEDGRIVGRGTHGALMKSCEVYREIAYSQLSKEELA